MPKKAKFKPTRPTPRKKTVEPTVVFHGVLTGQLRSTDLLTTLRAVRTGKQAREWLGLTLKDLGEALAKTHEAARESAYSKQYISQLENGHKPYLPDIRAGIARLMTDRIFKLTNETIGVSIRINSPWHIKLWRMCDTHGRFELKRSNQKRCPKCS
jgi:hypothetical protein